MTNQTVPFRSAEAQRRSEFGVLETWSYQASPESQRPWRIRTIDTVLRRKEVLCFALSLISPTPIFILPNNYTGFVQFPYLSHFLRIPIIVPGRVARSTFPGYLSSEAPSLLSDHTSDFLQRDVRSVAVTLNIYECISACMKSLELCYLTTAESIGVWAIWHR